MKEPATTQKLRGGYYTPKEIADFLADWAIQTPTTMVLEPSCGDGNIIEAAVHVLLERKAKRKALSRLVHGVEFNEQEALKTEARLRTLQVPVLDQIHNVDFFSYCREQLLEQTRFDAIIGNPPFIRYQNFPESQRTIAFKLMKQAGMNPTRLTAPKPTTTITTDHRSASPPCGLNHTRTCREESDTPQFDQHCTAKTRSITTGSPRFIEPHSPGRTIVPSRTTAGHPR